MLSICTLPTLAEPTIEAERAPPAAMLLTAASPSVSEVMLLVLVATCAPTAFWTVELTEAPVVTAFSGALAAVVETWALNTARAPFVAPLNRPPEPMATTFSDVCPAVAAKSTPLPTEMVLPVPAVAPTALLLVAEELMLLLSTLSAPIRVSVPVPAAPPAVSLTVALTVEPALLAASGVPAAPDSWLAWALATTTEPV